MIRKSILSALVVALAATAFAAPASAQQPRVVGNSIPWVPSVSPSGNINTLRFDCVAADPAAIHVHVECSSTNGGFAEADSDGSSAFVDQVQFVGGGLLEDFTFCAEATFTYAGGVTETVPAGCVSDDAGTATAIGV